MQRIRNSRTKKGESRVKPIHGAYVAGLFVIIAAVSSPSARASKDNSRVDQRIETLQKQVDALQQQLDTLRRQQAASASAAHTAARVADTATQKADAAQHSADAAKPNIKLGGAVRFQYTLNGYDAGNRRRHGDVQFDMLALNFDGSIKHIELSSQIRFYQYMRVLHHAWIGYHFTPTQQLQAGLTKTPFGVLPYDSHNYFFSSNYYLGLEDTYHLGAKYVYDAAPWNLQLAFFKNDGVGGAPKDSYTYNVVGYRLPGDATGADPTTTQPLSAVNTGVARLAYTFTPAKAVNVEVGLSGMRGGLDSNGINGGYYDAYAAHVDADIGRWNVQLEALRYHYLTTGGYARLAVGAYDFYDSIPTRADSYTANVAYGLPVTLGPVSLLTFYTDSSLVNDKNAALPATWMNVTGVSVTAGGLFTYFDFVTARNQPFIGGSLAGDGGINHRFNINVGYYF